MNLHTIILALAATALAAHGGADSKSDSSPKLRFAQITDVHLFDAGYNCYAPDVAIEQDAAMNGLKWAVDKINQENEVAALNFVVITGDFGIANLTDGEKPPHQHPTRNACNPDTPNSEDFGPVDPERIQNAAIAFACILRSLKVSSIYLLPGNNDVPYDPVLGIEDPAHRESYRKFVKALSHELRGRIRDLSGIVDPASDAPWDVAQGYTLIGLDTASFKPSDSELKKALLVAPEQGKPESRTAKSGSDQPPPPCPDPDPNSTISKARTSQLTRAVALADKAPGHFLLFTHIPDLQDPFVPRQVNGAAGSSKRCSLPSSWMLVSESRKDWTRIISNPNLVGVFAGHFHSPDASQYGGPFFAVSTEPATVVRKIYVTPPVSLKNQWTFKNPRRGLLIVEVQDNRVSMLKIDWYGGIHPTMHQGKPFAGDAQSFPSTRAWLKNMLPYGIAFLLFVGFWVVRPLFKPLHHSRNSLTPHASQNPPESAAQPPPEPT